MSSINIEWEHGLYVAESWQEARDYCADRALGGHGEGYKLLEAEAAQEAPAPDGLRAAIMDALYGLAGGGEHQQGEVRVRIEEAAAAIDTVLDHAATPSPAEPPRPDHQHHYEHDFRCGATFLAVLTDDRAEARPPEGPAELEAAAAEVCDRFPPALEGSEAFLPERLQAIERLRTALRGLR